jgi:hypothetical protein
MANLANKYKLGVFVAVSFIVLLTALFLLGFFSFMQTKIKCMTIVNSSVQGLSIGAKVKFSGVPIGEITDIKIARCNYIYIYMDIFTESLVQCTTKEETDAFKEFVNDLTKKGLRCQLRYEGITGSLYQELQNFDLAQYPKNNIPPPELDDILYIPSVPPVLFGSIIRRIDVSLGKLSGIDDIFKEVGVALKKVNKYLGNPKIDDVINNVNQISNNIHDVTTSFKKTLTGERIEKITNELTTTMEEIKQVVSNLNRQINRSKLPETSAVARELMNMTTTQLNDAIINFNATAKSVENLTNELNKNPSALIWGVDKKKIVPSY